MRRKWIISVICAVFLLYWLVSIAYKRSPIKITLVSEGFTSTPSKSEGQVVEKVQVQATVYYEALCPDSKHFFHSQLLPTSRNLGNSILIHLIPYGHAKTFVDPAGNLEFQCQHGQTECYANKIHACSLEFIKDNREQIEFITCMIQDNIVPLTSLQRCGKLHSLDTALISECANDKRGSELLKKYGEATHKINPSFIPTIQIENKEGDLALILKNFLLEICKHFPESKLPAGCV